MTVNLTNPASYRLLTDHYLPSGDGSANMIYQPCGTIVTEGIQIPFGFLPVNSEPQNTPAIQNFWTWGPPSDAEIGRSKFWNFNQVFIQPPPLIYWKPIGNGLWQLTGAGASLGPRSGQGAAQHVLTTEAGILLTSESGLPLTAG